MRNCAPSRKTGSETAVKADAGRDALSDRRLGRTDLSVSDNASQPESTASDSTQPYPDLGSPEGREGFAKHYDSVVGSTTMLVSSHADADAIAMAHHGSVSKDRQQTDRRAAQTRPIALRGRHIEP